MNIHNESILSNGLKIITGENPNSEIITISVWIKAGARHENKEQSGYAHILEHILMKGSKKYPTVFEFSKTKDRVGAMSNAFCGAERIYFFIQAAKKHLTEMFDLLADTVLNPAFDEKIFENEKNVIIQELLRANDNYSRRLWKISLGKIFAGHPLSRDVLGDKESISSAAAGEIKGYYQNFFIPNRAAVVVSSGVSHQEILSLSEKFFASWRKDGGVQDFFQTPKIAGGFVFEKMPVKQTHLAFNFASGRASFKELAVFEIIANYLGYGQSSRLNQELRHKRGLIYGVSANNFAFQDANLFVISTSTDKPKDTVSVISEEINNFEKHFTEKLFRGIKEQTASVFLREINNPLSELNFLGNNWKLCERLVSPAEWLKEIENAAYGDVLEAKNKYFSKNNLLIAAVGEKDFKILE